MNRDSVGGMELLWRSKSGLSNTLGQLRSFREQCSHLLLRIHGHARGHVCFAERPIDVSWPSGCFKTVGEQVTL
jgi:hypothetical protein